MSASPFVLGSFVAHLGLLVVSATATPWLETTDRDPWMDDQRAPEANTFFVAMAEPFRPAEPVFDASRCCQERAMGASDADDRGARHGVAGPKDNPDPHISRNETTVDAVILAPGPPRIVGGGPNEPRAPWGRDDALGIDQVSAEGGMRAKRLARSRGSEGLGAARPVPSSTESTYGYRCRLP